MAAAHADGLCVECLSRSTTPETCSESFPFLRWGPCQGRVNGHGSETPPRLRSYDQIHSVQLTPPGPTARAYAGAGQACRQCGDDVQPN